MFKKNTAVVGFGIGHFINTSTGATVTTGTPTCKRTLDGVGGACANAASYNSDGAVWEIDLAAADMNADTVILSFALTDCLPISYTIKTVTKLVSDLADTAAADIWSVATRQLTGTQTFNVTGNITGNLSGSVGSVTGAVGSVTGNVGGNVVGSVASVTGAVGSVTGNVGGSVASVTGAVGSVTGAVASVTGAVGSVTGNVGGSVASVTGAVGSVTGAVGSVTGAVGSVTGGVTVTTNNDKTGYGLSAAAVQAIWNALTSALTTAGSIGKKLADWVVGTIDTYTGNTKQTGDSYARLGAPAGASIAADIAAIEAQTDDIGVAGAGLTAIASVGAVAGAVGSVTGNVGGNVVGSVGSLATQAKADVNAEVDTAVAAIKTVTDKLGTAVELDVDVYRFTENALEQAPSGTGGDATAANQTTIIGHLTDIKGGTFDAETDALEPIRDKLDTISGGAPVNVRHEGTWIITE
jgi:hypothetical protein